MLVIPETVKSCEEPDVFLKVSEPALIWLFIVETSPVTFPVKSPVKVPEMSPVPVIVGEVKVLLVNVCVSVN